MRVLIAGMGSAVGVGVALELEKLTEVEAIAGFDLEPPRRWLRRAEFQFAEPDDAYRVDRIVQDFAPTVVVHAWVFEPRSRSSPGQARARTVAGTEALYSAIERVDTVERIVVRSGASIYGRKHDIAPTVGTALRPTSTFGRMLARVEERTTEVATALGAETMAVRFAPVLASSLPTPLGRYLRLPLVGVPLIKQRFGLVHLDDAARVLAAATVSGSTGPINVMGVDPVTPLEAVRIGRRVPIPVFPLALRAGRFLAELPGTPLPEHVLELLAHGLVIEPSDLEATLGVELAYSSRDAVEDLFSSGRLVDLDGVAEATR